MGAIFRIILTLGTTLLAGVGVGEIMDKVAADKIPSYQNPFKEQSGTTTGGYNFMKLGWMVAVMAIGVIVAKKVFRKKII